MTDHFCIIFIILLIFSCRATAKKLLCGFKLLMNFKARHEPDTVIIGLGSFPEIYISDIGKGLPVILAGIEFFLHVGWFGVWGLVLLF